ncbi:MAG TPA: DMT family transporter [Solirubrobacteraceae bacterium]
MKHHRSALFALAVAGSLWGLTVPLSKLALAWMAPSWLAVARFAVAAPLLGVLGRRGLRDALNLRVAATGAVGFGTVIVLQNLGIQHTSVSHAALVVGAVPVLVALLAAGLGGAVARPLAWGGYLLALVGIGLTAGSGGGGATTSGDLLVLLSAALSAAVIFVQPRLLAGRDPAAVTAVQFAAGALFALPVALLTEGAPPAPGPVSSILAFGLLATVGTLAPFWLFAYGQSRVPAELASTFVNLEPVVGAAVGWLAFGNTAAVAQIMGAIAVLGGIGLSASSARPSSSSGDARRRRPSPHRRAGSCPDRHEPAGPTGGSPRRFLRVAPPLHRGRLRRAAGHDGDGAGPTADRVRSESPPAEPHRASGSGPQTLRVL